VSQLPSRSASSAPIVQTRRGHINTLAIVSLASAVLSIFGHIPLPGIGGGTLALVAIITGVMARGQIARNGERGMWMANIGLVLGILHFALIVLFILVVLFAIFVLGIVLFGISR
jgi:hypothetical protein